MVVPHITLLITSTIPDTISIRIRRPRSHCPTTRDTLTVQRWPMPVSPPSLVVSPCSLSLRLDAAGVPATGQYGSKSAQSRQSLASPGLTPYQPHSPGMSEGSSHHPSSVVDQSSSQSGSNRYSKTPRQLPVPVNQVRQETDAGRVAVVPPSYKPAWAEDGDDDSPPRA
jgi:hypothetical protein